MEGPVRLLMDRLSSTGRQSDSTLRPTPCKAEERPADDSPRSGLEEAGWDRVAAGPRALRCSWRGLRCTATAKAGRLLGPPRQPESAPPGWHRTVRAK